MVRKQKELHVGLALSIRKIPERDRRSMARPYVHARFIFRMEWQNRDKKEEEEEDKRECDRWWIDAMARTVGGCFVCLRVTHQLSNRVKENLAFRSFQRWRMNLKEMNGLERGRCTIRNGFAKGG